MPHRVLHVLWDSERTGTSIARIVASLHRHLPASDFETSACFVGTRGPLVEEFTACGISTSVVPWKHPSRDVAGALRFAAFLFSSRFDVIHFHWGGPRLRRLGKMTGAKIVFHLHSSVEENLPGRAGLIDTRDTDAVIAVSRAVAASSSHHGTRVIYPGVEISPDLPRHEDPTLVGCALRLTPLKGVSDLLAAIPLVQKDFPSLRLEIAGDGPARAQLEAEASQLGLANQVSFLGWIDDLREHRSRWALMIQPSLEDGLPLSVVEAMSEGIPVVGTLAGGLPEIIADGETGILVPPTDPPALAKAIAALLRDEATRKRFGSASAARVRGHFSAQRMANETAELYRDLLRE